MKRLGFRSFRSAWVVWGVSLGITAPGCGGDSGVQDAAAMAGGEGGKSLPGDGGPNGRDGNKGTGGTGTGGTGTGGMASGKGGAGQGGSTAGSGGSMGTGGATGQGGGAASDRRNLGSCPFFPADNEWNRDITKDPVDPNSAKYLTSMAAATTKLHPDYGAGYGFPWIAVGAAEPRVPMSFDYAKESEPGPYPFPLDAPVEGGSDHHVLVVDRDACKLYEGFACKVQSPGWHCGSGAVFDLRSNALRPDGWTSADAAGLPIFPGLVRRSEVLSGEIRHALRFTAKSTQSGYVRPATHQAGDGTNPDLPPMGLRVRLKAGFDLTKFSGATRVLLVALQKYGMILADNGSNWFISGEDNSQWTDADIEPLKTVPASAFEVVKLGMIFR